MHPCLHRCITIETVVPIDLIHPGDHIEIRSGELIPADGRVVEGTGTLNKAPLTGESVPVDIGVGDVIEAGLVLAQGPVVCEVLAVGDNTRLSGLIDAVHTFREVPPRLHSGIEKFTAIWVPMVLFGAFAVWYFAFPEDWKIILLLWVVSCPCALLLATLFPMLLPFPMPHKAGRSFAAVMLWNAWPTSITFCSTKQERSRLASPRLERSSSEKAAGKSRRCRS